MEMKSEHNKLGQLLKWQDDFFKNLEHKGRSTNTLKNYKTDLDCFNNYLSDHKRTTEIGKFSIPEVMEYGKFLEEKYSSDNSRRRRVQALRLFFDYLVEEGYFNHNPVRKVPTSPKFLDIPRPASFAHLKTLWFYLLDNEKEAKSKMEKLIIKRNQMIFLLIYTGALKVSELSTIKKSDFSFGQNPRVLIRHQKRDPYTVSLPNFFRNIYESYIMLLEDVKADSEMNFDQLLFNANAHKIISGGISPRGIELLFKSWSKELVFEITPKSLRQACIFTWLQKGQKEAVIKEWMGVSPSYSLKLYRDHLNSHNYSDDFLAASYQELYRERA